MEPEGLRVSSLRRASQHFHFQCICNDFVLSLLSSIELERELEKKTISPLAGSAHGPDQAVLNRASSHKQPGFLRTGCGRMGYQAAGGAPRFTRGHFLSPTSRRQHGAKGCGVVV
jgi:hypothetical protein